MKRFFSILFTILITAILLSCNTTTDKVDSSLGKQWLERLTCEFPCWENIIPQETKYSAVIPLLKDSNNEITFADNNGISFRNNKLTGSIDKGSDDLVGIISLAVKNQGVVLGDLINKIGPPAEVIIYHCDPNDKCLVKLPYPEKETILELYLKDIGKQTTQVNLQNGTLVINMKLVGSDLSGYLNIESSAIIYRSSWKGFEKYP